MISPPNASRPAAGQPPLDSRDLEQLELLEEVADSAAALQETEADPSDNHEPARARDLKLRLARRLAETRVTVDRVLETVSESRLEARRLVTKELRFETRPEVLNTIVKIAGDRTDGGPRRELPRHLLTVHALVAFELGQLLDVPELDFEPIHAAREILPELLDLSRQIQAEITAVMGNETTESQDYLMQVCNSLDVPEEAYCTAMLLAPRLELFVRAGASGDLRMAVPSLNEDEDGLLCRLIEFGHTENAPGRSCLNSIALRSMMIEDMARWNRLCAGVRDAEESVDVEPGYLQRMRHEKTAFHFISDRLQDTQDSALLAGLNGFADEVRGFRQNLFSTYRQFSLTLRDATLGKASVKTTGEDSALLQLIEQTSDADAAADVARARDVSREELYLQALTIKRRADTDGGDEKLPDKKPASRSALRRMRALVGTAAVLAVVCAAVYAPILLAPGEPPELSAADFANAAALTQVVGAGGTMYARISEWSWNDLTPAERLAKVEGLAEIARSKGLDVVLLADAAGHELGYWSSTGGATLVAPAP